MSSPIFVGIIGENGEPNWKGYLRQQMFWELSVTAEESGKAQFKFFNKHYITFNIVEKIRVIGAALFNANGEHLLQLKMLEGPLTIQADSTLNFPPGGFEFTSMISNGFTSMISNGGDLKRMVETEFSVHPWRILKNDYC